MKVIDLGERLRRLDRGRRQRTERAHRADLDDAALLRRMADMIEQGRLRAVSLRFDASEDEVDTLTLTLRSAE